MSNVKPTGPYVYQPYGTHERDQRYRDRLWGVGGVSGGTEIRGLTKEEASAIVSALATVAQPTQTEKDNAS